MDSQNFLKGEEHRENDEKKRGERAGSCAKGGTERERVCATTTSTTPRITKTWPFYISRLSTVANIDSSWPSQNHLFTHFYRGREFTICFVFPQSFFLKMDSDVIF